MGMLESLGGHGVSLSLLLERLTYPLLRGPLHCSGNASAIGAESRLGHTFQQPIPPTLSLSRPVSRDISPSLAFEFTNPPGNHAEFALLFHKLRQRWALKGTAPRQKRSCHVLLSNKQFSVKPL